MKQIKSYSYLSVLLICLLLDTGCKKDKASPEIEKVIIPAEPPVVSPPIEKMWIPIRLNTGKSSIVFSYSASQALTKIDYGNGDRTEMSYNKEGNPDELARYTNKQLVYLIGYSYDKEGNLSKASMATVTNKGVEQPKGYYSIKYNAGRQPLVITYYANDHKIIAENQQIFSGSGNLLSENNNLNTILASYAYDTKNGLFKQVKYAWLFALEKEHPLFLSVANNISTLNLSSKTTDKQTFSYTYNSDQYPETIKTVANELNTSTQVLYQEVK